MWYDPSEEQFGALQAEIVSPQNRIDGVRSRAVLIEKIASFLGSLDRLEGGIVVAVSGGPDSICLLRALISLKTSLAIGPVIVAHFNHQLRGAESDADEEFVRLTCTALATEVSRSVRLRSGGCDVMARAKAERANLEAMARRWRYEWLAQVAREEGTRYVATGHTANDQAETVLHRLLRGSGLKGLRGIAPRRQLTPEIEVIRPILTATRAQVLAYLAYVGQAFRQDTSNRDLSKMRNRIRHELLPTLAAQYNPAIVPLLCRLARQSKSAYAEQLTGAARLLAEAELPPANSLLVFDRACLASAARPLVREAFRLVWARQHWPEQEMNFAHWDRLAGVALGEIRAVDFPGGIRARLKERVVQLGTLS